MQLSAHSQMVLVVDAVTYTWLYTHIASIILSRNFLSFYSKTDY